MPSKISIRSLAAADRCGNAALAAEEKRRKKVPELNFDYHEFESHTKGSVFPRMVEICDIMGFPPMQRAKSEIAAAMHDAGFNSSDIFAYRNNESVGAAVAIAWMRQSDYGFSSGSETDVATDIFWTNPEMICLGVEPPTVSAQAMQLADLSYITHPDVEFFFDQEKAFREEVRKHTMSGLYDLAQGDNGEWAKASHGFMNNCHRFWLAEIEEAWGENKERNLRAYREEYGLS